MTRSQEVLSFIFAVAVPNLPHSFLEGLLGPVRRRIHLQQLPKLPLVRAPVNLNRVQLGRARGQPVQDEVLLQEASSAMDDTSVSRVIV